MGREDRQDGYQALRGVLHAPRETGGRLRKAVDLSAQLPFLLRGVYHESWNPTEMPLKIRHRDDFLAHIQEHLGTTVTDIPRQEPVMAVLRVLEPHITEGELRDVQQLLPQELRTLWQEAMPA